MMPCLWALLLLLCPVVAQAGVLALQVTWEFTPAEDQPAPLRFTLYRSEDDQATWVVLHPTLPITERSYRDAGLRYGARYCYQIAVGYPPPDEAKKSRNKKYELAPSFSAPYFLGCHDTAPRPPLRPIHGGGVIKED